MDLTRRSELERFALEAKAITVFCLRIGYNPMEIGMGITDKGVVIISLAKEGSYMPLNIYLGKVRDEDYPRIRQSWSEFVLNLDDNLAQKAWNLSDFAKASKKQEELLNRLMLTGAIGLKAFKLPGDTHYRCSLCGQNYVSGDPIHGDVCTPCKEGFDNV